MLSQEMQNVQRRHKTKSLPRDNELQHSRKDMKEYKSDSAKERSICKTITKKIQLVIMQCAVSVEQSGSVWRAIRQCLASNPAVSGLTNLCCNIDQIIVEHFCCGIVMVIIVVVIIVTGRSFLSEKEDDIADIYHIASIYCGDDCGIKGEGSKTNIGTLIRSMIAFGAPRKGSEQQQLHYHLVLNSSSAINCSQKIMDDVQGWLDQDEEAQSWLKLKFHSFEEVMSSSPAPLDEFDEYLINGFNKRDKVAGPCTGFRNVMSVMKPFSEIDKVVYVDADVMMYNSVTRIAEEWDNGWDDTQFIGFVHAGKTDQSDAGKTIVIDPIKEDYAVNMNAGVLFLDLEKMRANKFSDQFKQFIKEGVANNFTYQYADQAQLNHYCSVYPTRCRPIDCGWNLGRGRGANWCLPEHRHPNHAVMFHWNWYPMHLDYYDLLRKENLLKWVRKTYATNVSKCQVERFQMNPRNFWEKCYPNLWKRPIPDVVGCPANGMDAMENGCQ